MSATVSVQTRGGSTVIVDAQDGHLLEEYTWCHRPSKRGAVLAWNKGIGGTVFLHQLIIAADKGMVIDHRNGNVCDNRRSNLRVCKQRDNARNMRAVRNKSCAFKGVARTNGVKQFRAYIWLDGKQKHLGSFDTQEEAAHVYDAAARFHFGEFCCVNFPQFQERSAIHDEVPCAE